MVKFQWPIKWSNKKDQVSKATTQNPLIQGRYPLSAPFLTNYAILNNTASWQQLRGMQGLFDWYHSNPVFYAIVQIKGRADSNRRFTVVSRKTGKIEPESTLKEIPRKIYALLNRPNCNQSRWEFLKQKKIFEEVCGNSTTYLNGPLGFKPNITNINSLWNAWPQYMQFKLTGKYFEATEMSDIVKEWKFEYGSYKKTWNPNEIFLRNQPNTDLRQGLIFGKATAEAMVKPLSNIDAAYESRNVIINNRGMLGMFTSDKSDDSGKLPLSQDEKELAQEEIAKYGTLEEQSQFGFSSMPLDFTPMIQDVRRLGLFDEIATDTMMCAVAWGVPEILIKLYLQGATFENQEASVRRLYQDTIIPEAEDDDIGMNYMLGLNDTDWMIVSSFDHIPALQKSKSEEAKANRETSTYMKDMFLVGGVTLNQWLKWIDLPEIPEGNRLITEMEPAEQERILRVLVGGQTQSQPSNDGETDPAKTKGKLNGHILGDKFYAELQ